MGSEMCIRDRGSPQLMLLPVVYGIILSSCIWYYSVFLTLSSTAFEKLVAIRRSSEARKFLSYRDHVPHSVAIGTRQQFASQGANNSHGQVYGTWCEIKYMEIRSPMMPNPLGVCGAHRDLRSVQRHQRRWCVRHAHRAWTKTLPRTPRAEAQPRRIAIC